MTTEEQKLKKSLDYKRWYNANRETLLAKQRERNKRNYEEKPQVYRERSKRWKKDNPEQYEKLSQKYRDNNKEAIKKRSAKWYAQNKERASKTGRINKLKGYGLTQKEFDQILESQNGTCAICGTTEWGNKTKNMPHVDHCHKTGKVRGLLCHKCNVAIGTLKDNPEIVMSAYNYLIKSQKEEII